MLHIIGWMLLLSPALLLQNFSWKASVVLGMIVIGVYFWLSRRRANKQAGVLGMPFSHFYGIQLPTKDIVQVLVREESRNCQARGQFLVVKQSRKKRAWLTGIYLFLLFVLMVSFADPATPAFATYLTILYIHLYGHWSAINTLCQTVTQNPDKSIRQILADNCTETAPRSRKPWAIAALALIVLMFFTGHSEEKFSFERTEGGYCLSDYDPSFRMNSHVTIPDTYKGEPVVAIGKEVFQGAFYLKQVEIPESVVSIDSYAFDDCGSLTQITLPQGLKTLNGASFRNCSALKSIVIPQGVTEIRGNTFEGCESLKQVSLHNGIVDIHAYAFKDCKSLESITLPQNITEIHTRCFAGCKSLKSIVIPQGVTRIAARAFWKCSSLKEVQLPDSLLEIRSSAFRQCKSLQHISIPSHTVVNQRAFKDSPTIINYR